MSLGGASTVELDIIKKKPSPTEKVYTEFDHTYMFLLC